MGRRQIVRPLYLGLIALVLAVWLKPAAGAAPARPAEPFAAPGFEQQWARTDDARVRGGRSWVWGPAPGFSYHEFYRESPHGVRLVQYFDKARMEINQPRDGQVSNGLLVVELVKGTIKLGDHPSDDSYYETAFLRPADLPVAGDPYGADPAQGAPSYANFRAFATLDSVTNHRDPERLGQPVAATMARGQAEPAVGADQGLASRHAAQTRIVHYSPETGHNIPAIFWDYLNQQGLVLEEGRARRGPIFDWVSVMGYPITDPYWVRALVGGEQREVLVQLFERRVLTFTPANQPAWQVEMGNVGQHYFRWRYAQLWGRANVISFASKRGSDEWQIVQMQPDGQHQAQITSFPAEAVPFSGNGPWLLIDSRKENGTRQIYRGEPQAHGQWLWQTKTAQPTDSYNPAVSPDGTRVAYVTTQAGRPQLALLSELGWGPHPLLIDDGCAHQAPSWHPQGHQLIWMASCDGHVAIYRGDLSYADDRMAYPSRETAGKHIMQASLRNVVQLSPHGVDAMFPRYSPDGQRIAFQSNRDGNPEIYTMRADGGDVTRLTFDPAADNNPSWSPDGSRLAFDSNRDGDWEIYTMRADGAELRQLTANQADDRWSIWH